jgi:hypothetical protein
LAGFFPRKKHAGTDIFIERSSAMAGFSGFAPADTFPEPRRLMRFVFGVFVFRFNFAPPQEVFRRQNRKIFIS